MYSSQSGVQSGLVYSPQAPQSYSLPAYPGGYGVPGISVPGQNGFPPQVMSPNGRPAEDMFLFVNPGSGGNKGKVFLDAPKPFMVDVEGGKKVQLHIFSMLEGDSGNKPGFKMLKEVILRRGGGPVRAVVGGGDGTVMWADSEAQKHGIDTPKQVAWGIVPLGTGNDFSRVAGWGGDNPENVDDNNFALLKELTKQWYAAKIRHHDVWEVAVNLDETNGKLLKIGKTQVEEDLHVTSKTFHMVNYFSIGQESQVGMHFDKHRTKSQTCNLFVYGMAGCLQELRCWGVQHIGNIVANLYQGRDKNGSLIMDSEGDLGEPQLIGNPESLMFLNISSYAGGKAHLWQLECELGVDPPPAKDSVNVTQEPGDGKLEVVTLPLIANIAMDKLVHQARKVCSGGPYFLEYFHGEDGSEVHAFFEVDGEFYHAINPETTSVYLFKKLQVLQRIPTGETSDEEWFDMPDVTCC